jgi:hypothetical protein
MGMPTDYVHDSWDAEFGRLMSENGWSYKDLPNEVPLLWEAYKDLVRAVEADELLGLHIAHRWCVCGGERSFDPACRAHDPSPIVNWLTAAFGR